MVLGKKKNGHGRAIAPFSPLPPTSDAHYNGSINISGLSENVVDYLYFTQK